MSEVLQRIDQALAGWEESAEAWRPGDPIYPHPYERDGEGQQCVRPMLDVLDDVTWVRPRCVPCQVDWKGLEPCWVCGVERLQHWEQQLLDEHGDPALPDMSPPRQLPGMRTNYTFELSVDYYTALEAAFRRMADTVVRLDFRPIEQLARAFQRATPTPVLSVDARAYRRRQLARRRRNRR